MKNNWKTLSSKVVYKNEFITFKKNKIIPPDGIEKEYPIIERISSVVIVPVDKNGIVYLVKQFRYMLNKTCLEIPAGYIEIGETPLTTAKRELAEEVHLKAKKWVFMGEMDLTASILKAKHNFYLARDFEYIYAKPDPTEDIEIVKMPIHDIIRLIMDKKIENGPTVTGILLALQFIKEGKI
jgi:ADP-ribose pyrophosphatase